MTSKLSEPNPEPTIKFGPLSPFNATSSGQFEEPLKTGRKSFKPQLIAAIERLESEGTLDTGDGPKRRFYDVVRSKARSMYAYLPTDQTGMSDQTIREAWHEAHARKQKTI